MQQGGGNGLAFWHWLADGALGLLVIVLGWAVTRMVKELDDKASQKAIDDVNKELATKASEEGVKERHRQNEGHFKTLEQSIGKLEESIARLSEENRTERHKLRGDLQTVALGVAALAAEMKGLQNIVGTLQSSVTDLIRRELNDRGGN